MKRIERLTAKDVWFPESTVSERSRKRLIMPRDRRASDTPSSRQLISRAYQNAIFIEAMPTKLRGMMSLFATGLLVVAVSSPITFQTDIHNLLDGVAKGRSWAFIAGNIGLVTIGVFLFFFSLIASVRSYRIDLTAPKENPIVFNRKTRKVYRYTPDIPGLGLLANDKGNFSLRGLLKYIAMTFLPWPGMLLVEYDWDCLEAEYYSQTGPSGNVIRTEEHLNLFVRDKPGSDTVIGSFPLALSFNVGGEALARDLWEHVRRFMEEGGPALSPGDKPAPAPPRTAWQAACNTPFGWKWVLSVVGTAWTAPEAFYFLATSFIKDFLPDAVVERSYHFPKPDMTYWWMLYPWWHKDWVFFFFVAKVILAFVCAPITAITFFAILAAKLSPKAELPDDLAADAGPRLDLNALAGASPDLPTQPAV